MAVAGSAATRWPALHAVCTDDVLALANSSAAAPPPPCGLEPLHLAAALGRSRCLRVLLDAGANPLISTVPVAQGGQNEPGDEEDYGGYEGVCKSEVYLVLRELLPNQAEFPYTFTLAQLLLKTPCSPLLLTVRFGRQAATHTLLAAVQRKAASVGGRRGLLDAALAYWPVASEPQVGLLQRLLAAGAQTRRLLPALLRRYDGCGHTSVMADRLRAGLREVLAALVPQAAGVPPGCGAPALGTVPLRQLVSAAVACRDQPRCHHLLTALAAGDGGWAADTEANCALLVAAAAHDLPSVLEHLLGLLPHVEGGPPAFSPNSWGPDGLSALMAAAHRGALGALGVLLDHGATINLSDEMGATALHWAVVGGSQEAVMALAQRGASVDQAGVVHEEEEHLERPLMTATQRCNLPMMRLLVTLGASIDEPSPSGYTPLSVAVCWEQMEAARLLLELGADPNQVLPPHVNGGQYQVWCDSAAVDEVHTLLAVACSRMEFREFTALLLEAGADPSLRHPSTGLTPAAEVAGFGCLEEAALLLELTAAPAGPWTLEQLGWADALAEAARNHPWHHSGEECLQPLLALWGAQPAPAPASPPPAACCAIVEALLQNPALKVQESTGKLPVGAELAGVQLAEQLATVGISADLAGQAELADSPCKYVVLAAAPAHRRWTLARHASFPPAFRQAVRQLLLANHRLEVLCRQWSDACADMAHDAEAFADEAVAHALASLAAEASAPAVAAGCAAKLAAAANSGVPRTRDPHSMRVSMCKLAAAGLPMASAGSSSSAAPPPAPPSIAPYARPQPPLPRDALLEVVLHLAAAPLDFWMTQAAQAQGGGTQAQGPRLRPTSPEY